MPRIDRRLLSHFEWPLLGIVVTLTALGLATILSATYSPTRPVSPYFLRQLAWTGLGMGVLGLTLCFDYRLLRRWWPAVYGASVLLLALVPLVGTSAGGATRWLRVGPLVIQPSEPARVAIVIALAGHLCDRLVEGPLSLRCLATPCLLIAIPALLILEQPDLGTTIAFGLGAATVLLLAGLPLRWVAAGALVAAAAMPFVWPRLEPYQQRRILTFLNPEADPLGSGYHVIQSKVAIGSGGWAGRGFLQGTQNQLNFLPEQHTDFIFAVFAEEWGFLGALSLLALYGLLFARMFVIASRSKDDFGALLVGGLSAGIFWQVLINIGMTTGILPVVGITLPFLSYGGSSLLALLTSCGLIMNVSMRRFLF